MASAIKAMMRRRARIAVRLLLKKQVCTCTLGTLTDIGHYTQAVWPATTKLGMARVRGPRGTYIVARYEPAGKCLGRVPGEEGSRCRFFLMPRGETSNSWDFGGCKGTLF